jgi:hypothetical protein
MPTKNKHTEKKEKRKRKIVEITSTAYFEPMLA